jgi:hypothetical protein
MSASTESTSHDADPSHQRAMFQELRERSRQQQRQRQQQIERLVQRHSQRALSAFRHRTR